MLLNMLILTIIIVFIIDLSSFIQNMEQILSKWLDINAKIPKPFSCSLCTTFWLGLLYILIYYDFSLLNILFVCGMAYSTTIIKDILIMTKDILIKVIDMIYRLLGI